MGTGGQTFDLTVYTDSDWAGDLELRRSTTGYLIYMDNSLISWASKRQQVVIFSSTEAELVALTEAVKEATWCQQLISEKIHKCTAINVLVDNLPCINLALKQQHSKGRTKHLDVKYKYIQQNISRQNISIEKVESADNVADLLTKPVATSIFRTLISKVISPKLDL